MNEELTFLFEPTRTAPTEKIERVIPKHCIDSAKCEVNLQIGLFFDGTNNNNVRDKGKMGHTNMVRLFDAYPDVAAAGLYRTYIPGVGTRFPEIGELNDENVFGTGFASGSEGRVLYGLLAIFDAIHRRAYGADNPLFGKDPTLALCRNAWITPSEDTDALKKFIAMNGGGDVPNLFKKTQREAFLKRQADLLKKKFSEPGKLNVKECIVDVFGFSRGAAQARVFCQWLDQLLSDGKLGGVIIHFRFVGLMDTVASAGLAEGIMKGLVNSTGGHSGWASVADLRILKTVKYCVHMVAMHELRKNFPLDELRVDGAMPPNCRQFAYPGVHSDIGGGYEPEELGVSVGKTLMESDSLKLAQIPLNHMLACAVAAGVPLNKKLAINLDENYDPFATHPRVEQAFNDFLTEAKTTARPLRDWLQPYLNWRWQVREKYSSLGQFLKATPAQQKLLAKGNNILTRDAEAMRWQGDTDLSQRFLAFVTGKRGANIKDNAYRQDALHTLDQEAWAVLDLARKAPATTDGMAAFFDGYVHDSYAGFCHSLTEPTGYWRYRKGFRGNDTPELVHNGGDAGDIRNAA